MATTFLFWNINKKPLAHVVSQLALEHDVDVLILVENDIPAAQLLGQLNRATVQYHLTFSLFDDMTVYTRFPSQFLKTLEEARGLTVRRLQLPGQIDIVLIVVHFPSKLQWSNESQALECAVLANRIRSVEQQVEHSRTVVVGDMNMNPFEMGMVSAAGMHAVMTRETASRGSRTIRGNSYPFFYNPMWGKFGDGTDGPAGTYYDYRAEQTTFFWNMFDQVIIRPELLKHFKNDELKILSSFGTASLINTRGLPDRAIGSDHLPILFKLYI